MRLFLNLRNEDGPGGPEVCSIRSWNDAGASRGGVTPQERCDERTQMVCAAQPQERCDEKARGSVVICGKIFTLSFRPQRSAGISLALLHSVVRRCVPSVGRTTLERRGTASHRRSGVTRRPGRLRNTQKDASRSSRLSCDSRATLACRLSPWASMVTTTGKSSTRITHMASGTPRSSL